MKILLSTLLVLMVNTVFGQTISVMTYNAENLFDTTHDPGKNDWTMLPLAFKQRSKEVQKYCASQRSDSQRRECFTLDWSEDTLNAKIKNLAKVILSYDSGKGADIIVFEEVENKNVLELLIKRGLPKSGYKYISLIEGPDDRGIDVGVISKYPIIGEKYHEIDITPVQARTTRGILEVTVDVKGKKVAVFANHWPSQANMDETRLIASEVLVEAATKVQADLVLALGDFNQTRDDNPHAINLNILPLFEDVETIARKYTNETALGTHWYRGDWESLDHIFVLKSSLSNVTIDYGSFDIINRNFMVRDLEWTDFDTGVTSIDENIPFRFNAKTKEGFSDHLPVAVKIKL